MKRLFTLILLGLTVFSLSACNDKGDDIIFDLILGDEITIGVDETFIDPGFIAKDNAEDISGYVVVSGKVDTTKSGTYTITYSLVYNDDVVTKTRTITVGSFNTNCDPIDDTTLQVCSVVWTTYLNTVVKLNIYIEQDSEVNTDLIFEEVEDILDYYTIMSDKYKAYQGMMNVHAINNNAGTTVTVDERLFNLIDFTFTEQVPVIDQYNSALGPVLQIWHDYREKCLGTFVCEVPTLTELQAADLFTDPTKVVLDRENLTLTMEEGMSIDLGGVSKGYVSREIVNYLDTFELHGYLMNNGESNISIGGTHPQRENGKFIIAVTDPTYAIPYYATVYLEDGEQLVTSGDYQKFYEVGDEKYHHIISPVSLFPESHSRSVSIVTSDAALADLYSTAIYNMTIAEGQAFVNNIDGLEAIWYGMDGTIYFSENFEENHLVQTFE